MSREAEGSLDLGFSDELEKRPRLAELSLRDELSPRFSMFAPTEVFNAYWRFACERQEIFFKRLEESPQPWTQDSILLEHKFTNAYRVLDRVSQFLIKNVQKSGADEDIFFRTILFKIFNRIETWEFLTNEIGELSWSSYNRKKIECALDAALCSGEKIYSAAYIMPSGGVEYKGKKKHVMHLDLIERMMNDGLPEKLRMCRKMQDAYALLISYPSIGPFLAYQYVTDINYTELTNFSENEFVVAGPGARRGVDKVFGDKRGLSYEEVISLMFQFQDDEFNRLEINFKRIKNRPLQLIDCQNLFCEIDKYARKAFTRFNCPRKPSRIKQKFVSKGKLDSVSLPKKWLNVVD